MLSLDTGVPVSQNQSKRGAANRNSMSSQTFQFSKNSYFPAQLLWNKHFIGGDLLTLPCLFDFKTCWWGTKVSITLNTVWMYTLEIVKIHGSDKQLCMLIMCVRCFVLRLGSQYRQAHDLNISARARRVYPRARATRVCEWWVQL